MKLLLTSAGITTSEIKGSLLDLLGKPFEKSNVVFIPTAANPEHGDKRWLIDNLNECVKLGFKEVDIVDIAALDKGEWLPRMQVADVIMVGGGYEEYLLNKMNDSGFADELVELLKSRVYVGISAGSMVVSERLHPQIYSLIYDEPQESETSINGLSFVDFGIMPHLGSLFFNNRSKEYVQGVIDNNQVKGTFYSISDKNAVKVVGDHIEVIGTVEGYVKYNP
jgi:dipeptidase E